MKYILLITAILLPTQSYSKDCKDDHLIGKVDCLVEEVENANAKLDIEGIKYLQGTTDKNGKFIISHNIQDYEKIQGIIVAIKHGNEKWYMLDQSDEIRNRFYWTKTHVEGEIFHQPFYNRPVKVIVFY